MKINLKTMFVNGQLKNVTELLFIRISKAHVCTFSLNSYLLKLTYLYRIFSVSDTKNSIPTASDTHNKVNRKDNETIPKRSLIKLQIHSYPYIFL